MFNFTKVYKTKAQAINAIRMKAPSLNVEQLDTVKAAEFVWPQAEGFVVNNAQLNEHYGFASVEQRVDANAIVDGKTLEAVSDALAEQRAKDAKAPKLQAPSKLEQDKAAVKAAKKAAKASAEPKAPTRCETKNGARRPLRGKTLLVWETTERMAANGEVPTLKQVHEELCKLEPGFNKTTAGIQYYACKAYNGWTK
jgi:hypothetical protein